MNTFIVGGAILAVLVLASMASAQEPEFPDPNTVHFTVTVRPEPETSREASFDKLSIHVRCDRYWQCVVVRQAVCEPGNECEDGD